MSSFTPPPNGIVIDLATVVPEWLDYNGHMNVAYFMKAFELGIDSYKSVVGLTLEYIETRKRSTVALEAHITYRREAMLGDALRVETRILECDDKRAHVYQELKRGDELLASQESMALSFDLDARRSAPFEPHVAANYQALVAAQSGLPWPAWVGRGISLANRKG